MIYLIGSLKNQRIPQIASQLRAANYEVFDEWFSAGPDADDHWKAYEQERGHDYITALRGYPARHVFDFDKTHIDRAAMGVLVCPAGKSGHLELGWILGSGRPGFILLDETDVRWDVMYQFATGVVSGVDGLLTAIRREEMKHR